MKNYREDIPIKEEEKEESKDNLNIFDDIDIMKIKDEDIREKLFTKKLYKIRDLYYKTK